MDEIDRAAAELCAAIGRETLERVRRKELAWAIKEADLKPGTDLWAAAKAVERDPKLAGRLEDIAGVYLLLLVSLTRVGVVLGRTADEEGTDRLKYILKLMSRGYARFAPYMAKKKAAAKRKKAR